jgi:Transposase
MGCEPDLLCGRPCDLPGCAASTNPSLSFCPPALSPTIIEKGGYMRSVALDVHRDVALEATGPALAIARILEPHVGRVVIANPRKLRAIAESKAKTDKLDASTLCELLAAGFLPAVWSPDEDTRALRRRLQRRAKLVRSRTRAKNECHAVLARNLKGRPPMTDVFGLRLRASFAHAPQAARAGAEDRGRLASGPLFGSTRARDQGRAPTRARVRRADRDGLPQVHRGLAAQAKERCGRDTGARVFKSSS